MMSSFMMNNKIYEIQANNQLSVVLSQFDANYIIDVIEDTIAQRLNHFDLMPAPNAVKSFEENFILLYDNYPNDHANIDDKRIEVYREIIDIICRKFNLQFEEQQYCDLYTIAYYLYDFFIARFNNYLITFYNDIIEKEKDNIYTSFKLEELKKNKDISTAYSKMAFQNDETIGIIVANLPNILSGLRHLNVSDDYIYRTIYDNNELIVSLFTENIIPMSSIFSIFNNILFNENMYATVITHIRMAIQMAHTNELSASA